MRVLHCAAVVICAAACSADIGPSGPKQFDRAAFVEARAKWQSAAIASYTVESRHHCFCPPHLNFWTRLTVRNGNVVEADPVGPLPSGISSELLGWRTVPELFEALESLATSSDGMTSTIGVIYDAALGYPREISIRCGPNFADCDRDFHLRSLARTP